MKLLTVLLVEDDEILNEMLSIYLDLEGLKVLSACNGEVALKLLKALPSHQLPDCIVLDLMMPIMDGNGLLRAMKTESNLSKIPVIMCSAFGAIEHSFQIVETLTKPVPLSLLKEAIDRCCNPRV
jgi:CheY-like chemotaxis protein